MDFSSEVISIGLDAHPDGHIGTLVLDNPAKRNAMGPAFWDDLPRAVDALVDADVRAIVLLANGPHFSVGLDLVAMTGPKPVPGESQAARRRRMYRDVLRLQRSITAVADAPVPVIAVVHGWCIGGGIDLICAADIRIASADA
jgi:enoyl-CoA hydratase